MTEYRPPGGSRGPSDPEKEPQQTNQLIESLPQIDRERVLEAASTVAVPAGQIICEPGRVARHVHFPLTGVLSSVVSLANEVTVEAAIIGNEGVAGIPALVNIPSTPTRIVQRTEGESLRLAVPQVQAILADSQQARGIIARYTLTLFQQSAQNVACNLHHRLEQRLCRWLVTTAERAARSELRLTQEFLAEMLGVSRQSVNAAAAMLQERGLISYRRGRVEIADRSGLAAASCECYESTRQAYHRLMQAA